MLPADAFRACYWCLSNNPQPMTASNPSRSPGWRRSRAPSGSSSMAGQSLLKVIARDASHAGIYLVHLVSAANVPQLALFEFDPGWLWQGADELADQDSMVIVDPAQNVVFEGTPLPPEILRMFARSGERAALRAAAGAARLAAGRCRLARRRWCGWIRKRHGSTARHGTSWSMESWRRRAPAALSFIDDVLPLLLLVAAAVYFATRYLTGRWQPVLTRLDAALRGAATGTISARQPAGRCRYTARRGAVLQPCARGAGGQVERAGAAGRDRSTAARGRGPGAVARADPAAGVRTDGLAGRRGGADRSRRAGPCALVRCRRGWRRLPGEPHQSRSGDHASRCRTRRRA